MFLIITESPVVICSTEYTIDKNQGRMLLQAEVAGAGQVSALLDGDVLCGQHTGAYPAHLLCHDVIHCLLISSATEWPKRKFL